VTRRPILHPALALLPALALAGCASSVPAPRLYQLRAAPPVAVVAVASNAVLQLMTPLRLPEVLDREALLVPQGQSGVQALDGQRWAEPLRDAVPRLLRQDLAALLGEARVWTAPLPAGVAVTRQLRVEVLAFEARADRGAVRLQARWSLADPAGSTAPQVRTIEIEAPSTGTDADALVAAHRLALWRLAERIAAAVR
jgi:hypothetical protein